MALLTQKPKGTIDVVPEEVNKWHTVEKLAKETAENCGFKEIRFPVFEHTELFLRSVGDTTDVVQKEMYTFLDKGNRSITLRPEGTAGAVRASLENGLLNGALPLKIFYVVPCFRYEKPQAGRYREFHQFGAEMLGSASPAADVEVISMANELIGRMGLRNIELHINSIGCKTCRAEYHKALREYFASHESELCPTCLSRLEKNPMRILDCKSPICSEIAKGAPKILDFLCDDCAEHFNTLQKYLGVLGISYVIDSSIVRGLDYYTRTVFEFISKDIGSQGTVCGGGRYDGLVEELGGAPTPALGFAMGLERIILTMQAQGVEFMQPRVCDLYIAPMGGAAVEKALGMTMKLREDGYYVETDTVGRGIKAQMKYANKIGARFALVIGDNELAENSAKLKDMESGDETAIPLDDRFGENFSNELMVKMLNADEGIKGLLK